MSEVEEPLSPELTGTHIPGLRSWRGVYVFVIACFVLYVLLMSAFTRAFS